MNNLRSQQWALSFPLLFQTFSWNILNVRPLKQILLNLFVGRVLLMILLSSSPMPMIPLLFFLNQLKNLSPHIMFTMEIEKNKYLSFLDVLVTHNDNSSLSHQVYKKKAHTNHYLNASLHHLSYKNLGVLNTLAV